MRAFIACFLVALAFKRVEAHGLVTAVKGANGVEGTGFGVRATVPRNGAGRNPFQMDTSIMRNREMGTAKASACGRTLMEGAVNIANEMAAAESAGLPSMDSSGQVTFTIHQINQDGAGPFSAELDTTGTGDNWQQVTITQNVPGILGINPNQVTDYTVVAQVPEGTRCTGGTGGNACIMRVRNNTPAGPFGSCFAFTDGSEANKQAPAAAIARRDPQLPKLPGGLGGLAGGLGGLGKGLSQIPGLGDIAKQLPIRRRERRGAAKMIKDN